MPGRIAGLQARLREAGIDAAVIMWPRDVYYYTGTAQPANLVVPADGQPVLLVRRALEFVEREVRREEVEALVPGAGVGDVRRQLNRLGIRSGTLGLTEDILPAVLYKKFQETFPEFRLANVSPLILDQRMIKDAEEIEAIRAAARLFEAGHRAVLESLRPGVRELDVSARVLAALREREAESIVRNRRWDASLQPEGLVVGSANAWKISGHAMTVTGVGLSPSLAWGASTTRLQPGDMLVLDVGINRHGYHADIARTYVVGLADERQREVFAAVRGIQDAVIAAMKPGTPVSELYRLARSLADQYGVGEYFQGYGDMQGQYLGHSVGLELDELPTIDPRTDTPLAPGMVLAIEPKVIIPYWGGVDIEDTFVITEDGPVNLSPVGRDLFEVVY